MSILYNSEPLPLILTLFVIISMYGKVNTNSVPKYWVLLMLEFTAWP